MKSPIEDTSMHTAPWDVFLSVCDYQEDNKNPIALCSGGTMQNADVEWGC